MSIREKAQKKIRKVLFIGSLATIYGILVTFLVDDFETFFASGFGVLMIDALVLWAVFFIRKQCKEKEDQEDRNRFFK